MAYFGKNEWLVKIRKEKNISQGLLAAECGCSQAMYSRIELGFSDPSEELAQKIADYLGFPVERFREEKAKREASA